MIDDGTIDGVDDIADTEEITLTFDDEVADLVAAKGNVVEFAKCRKMLHEKYKNDGVLLKHIDDAVAILTGGEGKGPTHADILIGIGKSCTLFHAPDGTGYADIDVNGHRETVPIRGRMFKRYLARRFYEKIDGAPNNEAISSALGILEAQAHFDGAQVDVAVRVAGQDGKVYFDLGGSSWNAVEVGPNGWCVVDEPLVHFRRSAGMKEIPAPEHGGDISDLRAFLNVKSDQDFILLVCWLLAALRDHGPYPVVVLTGEQGSAKSTGSGFLKALIDPNTAPLRALPRDDRDLFIAANNGHVLAFDNVSGLSPWISDTLCRLATGGGFAVRQLFTDQDETLFDATRPVVLNGIEDFVSRPDLADRSLFIELSPIDEERRKPESELWAAFDRQRPKLFGVLLDAMAHGLKALPETRLSHMPRMADFAVWATACETSLWPSGTFEAAYSSNRKEAIETVIESDLVATAIRNLAVDKLSWSGTSTELLEVLNGYVSEGVRKTKAWPSTPRGLGGKARRAATFLRKVGVNLDFVKVGHTKARVIHIHGRLEKPGFQPSAPSASSAVYENSQKSGLFGSNSADGMRTVADGRRSNADGRESSTVRTEMAENSHILSENLNADGADGQEPHLSADEMEGVL